MEQQQFWRWWAMASFVTRGGNFGSTIPLSQLVKGGGCRSDTETEWRVGEAEGPGMRIIAGWLASLEVAGVMTIVVEGKVKPLSPQGPAGERGEGRGHHQVLPERPYDGGLQDGAAVHVNHPSDGSRGQGKDREVGSGGPRGLGRA